MSILTETKIDNVVCGLAALNVAIRKDYDNNVHDFRFDVSPDPSENGNPVLWDAYNQIEVEFLDVNSYRAKIRGLEFLGSMNETRIVLASFYRSKQ